MKVGVLFIHGFTGGSFEVRPFMNYLKLHTDWDVQLVKLPGHDISLELRQVSASSWLMEAELAYRNLQKEVDHVMVVGFSMGGLIALYLALRYPVDKLILLSAAARYISPRHLMGDLSTVLTEKVVKRYPPNTFYHLYDYKLTHTPLHAIREFLKIVKTVEPYYDLITTPVCIVQGKKDGVVPHTSAQYLFDRLGSEKKEIIYSDCGKHHICYSDDCDEWFSKVLCFMREDFL